MLNSHPSQISLVFPVTSKEPDHSRPETMSGTRTSRLPFSSMTLYLCLSFGALFRTHETSSLLRSEYS